jgi:SOS-response transcriptional repressor LexA
MTLARTEADRRPDLTPKQAKCLAVMERYYAQHGVPAPMRAIGVAMGGLHVNAVACHIKALAKKGHVAQAKGLGNHRSYLPVDAAPPRPGQVNAIAARRTAAWLRSEAIACRARAAEMERLAAELEGDP